MTDDHIRDRVGGVLLGQACGDALGVPYEFGSRPLVGEPRMLGGGLGDVAPGEWSDDTQMAICIAEVVATGADLTSTAALDAVAERFLAWAASGPADAGIQTTRVLALAGTLSGSPAHRLTEAAYAVHRQTGRSGGNGALMRTAVVGLTRLDDRDVTAAAARAVASLTHYDPQAGDASVLWSEAVRVAVTTGSLDVASGLDLVPADRLDEWAALIADAETRPASIFTPNAWTVTALQAAWSAIVATRDVDRTAQGHYRRRVIAAVEIGNDTDTTAAIAGGLLGAAYGASAIPAEWRAAVHGWRGARSDHEYRADDVIDLALRAARV